MIGSICDTVYESIKSLTRVQILVIILIAIGVPAIVKLVYKRNVENFNSVKGDKPVFRMFHVKWCGHCKVAKPEFAEFMKENSNVNAEMIDAEDAKNKAIVEAYDIEGYPTFIVSKNGKDTLYEGERTKEGFAQFAKENL
jgi:thiol-disulfide isomerase/thioredoxin